MPLYKTSEEWTHYTTLLLRARPTTACLQPSPTRIVTKYTIPPLPSKSKVAKLRAKKAASTAKRNSNKDTSAAAENELKSPADCAGEKPSVGYLELRAYDPESGACLKYRTEKAAEVGRLVAGLGRMGRVMAALPEVEEKEDVVMGEAGEDDKAEEKVAEKVKAPTQQTGQQQGGQAQGGKGKKKKGKR
ncbi:hypothetical protein B9Z65_6811 [Elsinoe australis]|uniref:SRP9 domain-containing protein n=1 Tax=Elsinoe australis TaxID=40998 RepID=A0A2P7Z3R1_9PEZI|nr:hypothetical protein B9Z65_6811 [Elsinoe australis]